MDAGRPIGHRLRTVLFSSNDFELFEGRVHPGTPVHIIPTKDRMPTTLVEYTGRIDGYIRAEDMTARDWRRRPVSTDTDSPAAGHYVVSGLKRVAKPFDVSELTLENGSATGVPRKPTAIL